ncbi:hypothetical protein SNEBB_002288 [Seison nebaliae]|nr:hypothetical protein SNEBB_002288 [Seison nebaliae]
MLCGITLLAIGIWSKIDPSGFPTTINNIQDGVIDGNIFQNASTIIIIIGAITVVLSFLSCYGTYSDSQILLTLYFLAVGAILIMQIGLGLSVAVLKQQDKLRDKLSTVLMTIVRDKMKHTDWKNLMETMQASLKCCGALSHNDYGAVKYDSCLNPDTNEKFDIGCVDKIINLLNEKVGVIVGAMLVSISVEICGIVFTVALCFNLRREKYYW